MSPIQWVLIVLLVLLIAVGVYMLTRKPASRQDRNEEDGQISTNYGAGGEHVAAGDAGATPSASLYDQEADAVAGESSVEAEPIEAPVWQGDDSLGQDTATGGDIEIVEEEPVISATEDVEPIHAPADPADHGDREQMAYGDPQAEDFASETVYAEAPVEDYAASAAVDSSDDAHSFDVDASDVDTDQSETATFPDPIVVEDSDDVPDDAAAAGFMGATGATVMGSELASDEEPSGYDASDSTADVEGETATETDSHDAPMGHAHDHPVTESPGPEAEDDVWTEGDPEQGHPGGSQPGDEETYPALDTDSEGSENPGPEEGEGGSDDGDADVNDVVTDVSVADDTAFVSSYDAPAAESAEIEIVDPEVAFADGSLSDEVVDEVVVEEVVIVDEPVSEEPAHEGDQHDTEEDPHAPVAVEKDHTETAEQAEEPESTDDDQPQAVMVDVNDYGTHESVQPDHDSERHDSDRHEGDHGSEFAEHPATQDVAHDEVAEETAYAPVVAEDQQLDTSDEQPVEEPVEEPADEPNPLIEASPYGVGSAIPGDDGHGPDGFEIKGNAGSMLFHTPESPSYDECTPEVFFDNEDAARAAGFAHWDRKRR